MNKIWLFVLVTSIGILLLKSPNMVLDSFTAGSTKAVTLSLELCAIYAVWSGILKILEETGISKIISKMLSPIIDFLFGRGLSKESKKYISMNMTANILGMGGAATPMGIRAIETMDNKEKQATPQMIMLIVLCATSLQIVPTSIIGLLSKNGSSNATSIILPSLLSSFASTFVGVMFVKLLSIKKAHSKKFALKRTMIKMVRK